MIIRKEYLPFLLLCLLFGLEACKVGARKSTGQYKDSRDGEVYGIVGIGKQVWMLENMRYVMEGSYVNPDNPNKKFGRLYTWKQAQRVCPKGWHLPSDEEWKELERYLGMSEEEVNGRFYRGDIGAKLRAVRGWYGDGGGDNSSGFKALPAGSYRAGNFRYLGKSARFWSSTQGADDRAWYRDIIFDDNAVDRNDDMINDAYSCRCLRDVEGE